MAELETTLGADELDCWYAYWVEEPWGSYRDNIHAGLIASACLAPHQKPGNRATFEDFMIKSAAKRRADDTAQSLDWLMSVAKPK